MLEFVTGALVKLLNGFNRRGTTGDAPPPPRGPAQLANAHLHGGGTARGGSGPSLGRFSIFDVVARPVPMTFVFFSTADTVRRKVGSVVGVQSFASKRETPRRCPPYL